MYLIIGLGNPGTQYCLNRHNVGFMAIDVLARHLGFPEFRSKSQALLTEKTIASEKIILCKPTTFMNLSGQAVQKIVQFYKISLDRVAVIHDDLDLAPGELRTKQGGSAGGHNGLRSLDQMLGSGYWRIRVGIGHPGHSSLVSNYVLSNFTPSEQIWLEDILGQFTRHTHLIWEQSPSAWLQALKNPRSSTRV